MNEAAAAMVLLAVFGWGLWSARLGRADLTAPILFVSAGLLLSTGPVPDPEATREVVRLLAEITLVWVLFADASRVGLPEFRADLGLFARLLGIGLPLTIAVGTLLAAAFFGELGFWLALLIGAALAPTDAALGAAVMSDPSVPERIRRTLNVESGLNDGIATPVVSLAIAGAATATVAGPQAAIGELAIGVAVGIGAGLVGGRAMRTARARGWASEDFAGPGVLALALAVYTGTHWLDGNGFVAAFVAGIVFGAAAGRGSAREVFYVEQTAGLASLLTWLIFGAAAVPIVIAHTDWLVIGYALLSLTVIRMLPAGLSLIGTGLPLRTIAFISWFGPRGLASIVFAMLAVEDLGPQADRAVAVIGLTVLFSVFAHGLTAKPLAARFAWHNGQPTATATAPGSVLAPADDDSSEAGTAEEPPEAATRPPSAAPDPARSTTGPHAGPPDSGEDATAPAAPERAGSPHPAGVLPARGLLHRHPAHHRPAKPWRSR
ncbi:NhaP-type Na+/H+ or K+/H+ antiporter [Actinoplanes campanulatus]|uniref:NhaP-type Na+/H+ or K+/H+ antiporter n=1 Tax=Actinoplanes campanulatus TaxID=113559 RepID=A0A7W5ACS0_9ACTN|nr:cation:proton antiporter [Actinoplanes campanulatus]MBB3093682.1 NhaP-type Na+/H+ or K+/H+ antiporter [Actinoplanes campanulatus]GGN05024.1 sodium:proton antiporter [Actinoplanes campanulatus]GID35240.1 sodium:proton antiporter [Actinoplanes campanulatus]